MRICRFTSTVDPEARPRLGLLDVDGVRDITAAALPPLHWPLPPGDQLIANLDALRPQMERVAAEALPIPRSHVRLFSPVANPGKFICGVGNWSHHRAPRSGCRARHRRRCHDARYSTRRAHGGGGFRIATCTKFGGLTEGAHHGRSV